MDPRDVNYVGNDNVYAVFRMFNVKNPVAVSVGSDLFFNIYHDRYTYEGGPTLTIHGGLGVAFEDDIAAGGASGESCDFTRDYSQMDGDNIPANLLIFVDFEFTLDHPVIEGGKIAITLDGWI